FLEFLESGATAEDAALAAGISASSAEVLRQMRDLEDFYIPDPELRKKLVIAQATRQMLTGANGVERAAAMRILTGDPDLGFNQPATVTIKFSEDVLSLKPSVDLAAELGRSSPALEITATPTSLDHPISAAGERE